MISKILGCFWILLGVLWLWKPNILKSRMGKKTVRRFKWFIYGFIFFLVLNLAGIVIKIEWLIFKILGFAGILALIKTIIGMQSKTSDKFFEWWDGLPIIVFRLIALFSLGTGLAMIFIYH